jgi:integrase
MDMEAGGLFVPAARMKLSKPDKEVSENEHFVPLSSQALEILRELKELSRGSKFVFPGRNRDKPISNNTMLFALYRLGYKGKMTGHGVRAVASTMMNGQGYSPDVIEAQLAHKEKNRVRAAYNRAQYVPERTKLMQTWADYLWAFLREPAEGQAREVEKTQISPSPMRIIGKAAA